MSTENKSNLLLSYGIAYHRIGLKSVVTQCLCRNGNYIWALYTKQACIKTRKVVVLNTFQAHTQFCLDVSMRHI